MANSGGYSCYACPSGWYNDGTTESLAASSNHNLVTVSDTDSCKLCPSGWSSNVDTCLEAFLQREMKVREERRREEMYKINCV